MISSRAISLLLCAAAIIVACGPRVHDTLPPSARADTPPAQQAAAPAQPMLASSLDVGVREGVTLALHVTNTSGGRIELRFPTGQLYDFVVLDAAGAEVWRWSAERMFTQALQTRMLEPSETLTLTERWDAGGRTGTFTAVATLRSASHPVEQRVEFSLP